MLKQLHEVNTCGMGNKIFCYQLIILHDSFFDYMNTTRILHLYNTYMIFRVVIQIPQGHHQRKYQRILARW